MKTIILAIVLFAAMPAYAGWKMYAPGQKEAAISSTQTGREAERRANKDQRRQDYVDYVRANTAILATPQKRSQPICTPAPSCPVRVKDDGPRPGGHRRHEWREQTGYNTPAERTRYRRAVWEEQERARKERARPNPAGDHPEKIRKQFQTKF